MRQKSRKKWLSLFVVFFVLANYECFCADVVDREDFVYARSRVLVRDQVSLTARDIIENTEDARNYFDVFRVNLANLNFDPNSDDENIIIAYFKGNSFPNLRVIELCSSKGVGRFIDEIFGATAQRDRFYSLMRINASKSDIAPGDMGTLFNHFAGYSAFIRDMEQISGRYDVAAVSLSVDVDGCTAIVHRGIHNDTHSDPKTTYYRAGGRIGEAIFMVVKE